MTEPPKTEASPDRNVNAPVGREQRPGSAASSRPRTHRRFRLIETSLTVGVGLLATIVAMMVTGLYPRVWGIVWAENDAMGVYTYAVNLSRGRWYLVNPDLGYPGFQDHGHFPLTDLVSLGQIGLLAQVLPPITAVNLFTLGTYFTVAATSYLAARYAGITRAIALATALAFSLLPWHFNRAGGHLWLGSYMSVPLTIFLLIALARGDFERSRRLVFWVGLAAAVVVGANGVYYALMSTILLAALIVFGSCRAGKFITNWRGVVVAAAIPLTVAMQVLLSYVSRSSRSTGVTVVRATNDSITYGGNLTSLFRPDSRTTTGQLLGRVLDLNFPGSPEGDAMLNGATALAILLTCWLVGLRFASWRAAQPGTALRLTQFWPGLFLLVLGFTATGGLGALFSRWFSNEIRSWGRFTIFLAGIALLVLGLSLTSWIRGPSSKRRIAAMLATIAIAITAIGDIANGNFRRDISDFEARAGELQEYIASVEARTAAGCPILQLPIVPFPEYPHVNAMGEYNHFWTYLYSHDLRWSYGAFKGTEYGNWGEQAKDHPHLLMRQAREDGFCGIQVDTWAWKDSSEGVPQLAAFGWPDVISGSGRWLYFDLTGLTTGEYVYFPATGFTSAQRGPRGTGQWSLRERSGSVTVLGQPNGDVDVRLRLAAPPCGPTSVKVDGTEVAVSGTITHQLSVRLDGSGSALLAIHALEDSCWEEGSTVYLTLLVPEQLDLTIPAAGL